MKSVTMSVCVCARVIFITRKLFAKKFRKIAVINFIDNIFYITFIIWLILLLHFSTVWIVITSADDSNLCLKYRIGL